jgi:hypothetical protein
MAPIITHLRGVRRIAAAAVLVSTAGCSTALTASNDAAFDPETQTASVAATATCEQQHASHALTRWAQVAKCEYDVAFPEEVRKRPRLAPVLADIWSDKIELYAQIDRGELTKAEADRKIDIETNNRMTIIQSMHQF